MEEGDERGSGGADREPGVRHSERSDNPTNRHQQQFNQLAVSQDTLVSLAADTGGRAFTDSNDFSKVFEQVRRDMSGYYLLGYSSTNATQDGRFRRVQVRLKRSSFS